MEVLKYERTKAQQLTMLPKIATSLKPYRFARADTKGPGKVDNSVVLTAISPSSSINDFRLFALTFS